MLDSIEKSKNKSVAPVIFALGIPHVGDQCAGLLAEQFHSIDQLAEASQEEVSAIPYVGPKIAESIVAFFAQEANRQIIEKLRKAGVNLEKPENVGEELVSSLPLAGLEFVLTGKLASFSRSEAQAKIKALGGKAGSDVTKTTSYVVVGADPGSKLAKAEARGMKTLSEADFLDLLNKA